MSNRRVTLGELALLSQIRQHTAEHSYPALKLGIGDDCAILRPGKDEEIIVTTDLSLEDVHFRRDWHTPESVGHRCLTRGLSDIAAMGGRPLAAFLSLAMPADLARVKRGRSWMDRFYDGLLDLAKKAGVPLAGGDLAQSPTVLADIVLIGGVAKNSALLRSGAREGDYLYVSGDLGGSSAELFMLARQPKRFARINKEDHPHLFPSARLSLGRWLNRKATAAIDISDGLSTDLMHLCEESEVAAEIDADTLPIHPLAKKVGSEFQGSSALELALNGGEDYELLFTTRPTTRIPKQIGNVPVHKIGRITGKHRGKPMVTLLLDGKAMPLAPEGWQHFNR
jgi:thiamine-monophosphate kinase